MDGRWYYKIMAALAVEILANTQMLLGGMFNLVASWILHLVVIGLCINVAVSTYRSRRRHD